MVKVSAYIEGRPSRADHPDAFIPHEGPQEDFLRSSADIAIIGGSAGPGKSYALREEAKYDQGIDGANAVFFRRDMPQVRAALWAGAKKQYAGPGVRFLEPPIAEVRWPSGAKAKFTHMHREEDKEKHDGAEYSLIAFDELQHFTESQFWYMLSRNRTTSGAQPRIRGSCNPPPHRGHWLRRLLDWWIGANGYPIPARAGARRYFYRDEQGELVWCTKTDLDQDGNPPMSIEFYPATVDDNPTLLKLDPGYKAKLAGLEKGAVERLLKGNWNVSVRPAGVIYPEFDDKQHLVSEERARILEAEHIQHWQLYEAWDFGTGPNAATAVVWAYFDGLALYLWESFDDYEKPYEHYAAEVGRRGYFTTCKLPADDPASFRGNPKGRRPNRRLGDPAGRARDSAQRSWFKNLRDACGIELDAAKASTYDAHDTVRTMLRRGRILVHPSATRLAEAMSLYKCRVPSGYDPATYEERGQRYEIVKDWTSHLCEPVGYIADDIWGHLQGRVTPARGASHR